MKRCILIAGGPETELGQVREELAVQVPEWEWLYAGDGMGAVDVLTRRDCDAVVADLRLGGLTGLQLLNHVMMQWPRVHRVILADLGDVEALLRCVGGGHQFLARPCEAQRLKVVLERAFTLDFWLPNLAVRRLLGSLPGLPSPAEPYHAVVAALEAGRLDTAASCISNDPPLAAKVLQLANSAAYGPPLDESDPAHAAAELGLENVRRMILLAHTASAFRDADPMHEWVTAAWRHAQRTSKLARSVAEAEGAPLELVLQAAIGGLLHDLGKVALAVNLPEEHLSARRLAVAQQVPLWEAEQRVFGATHGEVGGVLLGLWGLPMPVVEAVALHHHPACLLSDGFCPLTAVHVANILEQAPTLERARERLDLCYLDGLALVDRVDVWWQRMRALQEEESGS